MLENNQFQNEEIWKEIAGFEGLYAVSNKGKVMNLKSGKVLKNLVNTHGYARVGLCNGNGTKRKMIRVHRLVAQAFIPNPNNLPYVNHIDECKTNNDVTNLEWCTASQNTRHSVYKKCCRINQLTLDGEFIRQWESSHEIERKTGYNKSNIIQCCKNKCKTAYRYKWQYADPSQQQNQNRPIAALTMDRDLICEYKNATEAARCFNICERSIRYCLKGTLNSTHGLRFIYIDDLIRDQFP